MRTRSLLILLLVSALAGVALALPGSSALALPPLPVPTCSPGPADCSAWHSGNVTVTWSTPSCAAVTISSDTGGTPVSCTTSDPSGSVTTTVNVKRDATPPQVWGIPARRPDSNGWYNREVSIDFGGTDALSGIASCSKGSYKGPDSGSASVGGSCTDVAGNQATGTFELRYDTTPPSLGEMKAEVGTRGVVLRWKAAEDALTFAVVRQPGLTGPNPSTIYTGKAHTFTDRRLQNGVKYRYTVTAYDQAGNGSAKGLVARPASVKTVAAPAAPGGGSAARWKPAVGARVTAPPRLTWVPLPAATYYNVQLFRNGQKIFSAWPKSAVLRLQASWKFEGRGYTLTPGRYHWYVWPGFGKPSANSYGKLLGSRSFVVIR